MLYGIGMVCLVLWFSLLGTSCVHHTPLCLPGLPCVWRHASFTSMEGSCISFFSQ